MIEEEPFKHKSDSDMIWATSQNQYGFPNPDFILPLNEDGYSIQKKLPTQKIVISHYWIKQKKLISIIGIGSTLILVSILIQETGIFDTIFTTLTNLIISMINYVMGIFS